MGMYIESGRTAGGLAIKLQQVCEETVKGGAQEMFNQAGLMRDMAALMAPRKFGTLENSIERERVPRGERMRTEVRLFVNLDDIGPGGQKVSEYAERMENGEYNLGPGSQAKNEGTMSALGAYGQRSGLRTGSDGTGAGGLAVGPHFFKRALDRGIPKLAAAMAKKMRSQMQSSAMKARASK